MLPNYLKFLEKPAEQEFFLQLAEIKSRDSKGNAVSLSLVEKKSQKSCLYCDKIYVGETLESAVNRIVSETLGFSFSGYLLHLFFQDVVKQKNQSSVTRFSVTVFVSYCEAAVINAPAYDCAWVPRTDAFTQLVQLEFLQTVGTQTSVPKEQVIKFIESLYDAGALDIQIEDSDHMYDLENGIERSIKHPDILTITLPVQVAKRKAIASLLGSLPSLKSFDSHHIDEQIDTISFLFT